MTRRQEEWALALFVAAFLLPVADPLALSAGGAVYVCLLVGRWRHGSA